MVFAATELKVCRRLCYFIGFRCIVHDDRFVRLNARHVLNDLRSQPSFATSSPGFGLGSGSLLRDLQLGRLPLLQLDLRQFFAGERLRWLAWLQCDVANLFPWLNPERNGGHRLRKNSSQFNNFASESNFAPPTSAVLRKA